jgi:WD40 repeat protein
LMDGHPMRALPYLVAARAEGIDSPVLRILFAQAAKHAPLVSLVGHGLDIVSVVFSPDGSRVATVSMDYTARIWDAKTGRPMSNALEHHNAANAVAFSPDGTLLATASADRTARVWNAQTGEPVTNPLMHHDQVETVAFSPDCMSIVTSSADGTAWLWNARTGNPRAHALTHQPYMNTATFSPDGDRVLTCAGDGARVWDVISGQQTADLLTHRNCRAARFSADGAQVMTMGDSALHVWDATTGALLATPWTRADDIHSWLCVLSPGGTRLMTSGGDSRNARVWDYMTGQPVCDIAHRRRIQAAAFNADGSLLVTGSR